MLANTITLGDKVTIIQEEKENVSETFVSSVLEMKDEETFLIGIPTKQQKEVSLITGTRYQFCFYTKRGLSVASGTIEGTEQVENLPGLCIKLTEGLKRFQRRQYYRLNKKMDMRFQCIAEKTEETFGITKKDVWNKAILTDISGGGARFHSKEELTKDSKIRLKLCLRIQGRLKVVELISKVMSSATAGEGNYETRVEFIENDIAVRELIIKFIFEEERKQLRREKGLM